MGHIKEPEGVDFVINGKPLTKDEEIAISNYIKSYRAKNSSKHTVKQTLSGRKNRKKVLA